MKILIKNALAILPEMRNEISDVYIENENIIALNTAPVGFVADKIIDGTNKLLVPGFVNAHTHVYMTALRNRADDLNFMTWLFDNVIPLEDKLSHEDAYWSVQLGCMEMLLSGTTCLMDMHMFPSTTPKALADCGFRGVVTRGLQGSVDNMEGGMERISQAIEEMERFADVATLSFKLAPHAPYTCDETYLRLVAETAKELNCGIHVHISESQDEQNTIKTRYNCTPTEMMDRNGILTENTACAHCVYLSEGDIEILAKRGSSVIHNPASNMKLGNGFAPVPLMLKRGVNVAIGTDGACSNNNQSMLREMQLAALIHKGTSVEATTVTAAEVFEMATINGAKALGLSKITGEIKVGKRADLSLFSLDTPGFFPLGDPKSALCYSSAGQSAETVLVNGRILLEKGEFKTIDVDRVRFEINALTKRLNIK